MLEYKSFNNKSINRHTQSNNWIWLNCNFNNKYDGRLDPNKFELVRRTKFI